MYIYLCIFHCICLVLVHFNRFIDCLLLTVLENIYIYFFFVVKAEAIFRYAKLGFLHCCILVLAKVQNYATFH